MLNAAQHLTEVGFNLSLSDTGKLLIAPATKITPELRTFIQTHRMQIVASLREAANDPVPPSAETSPPPQPTLSQADWENLDKAYQTHHFGCPSCIAAGKGYGLRCGTGSALWANYNGVETG